MSSENDTCKFGHVILTHDEDDKDEKEEAIPDEIRDKIEEGKIGDLEELERAHEKFDDIDDDDEKDISDIVGDPYKTIQINADSQGFPRAAATDAADKWDEDLDYEVDKTEEKIFVSPQSNLHGEYMQRRQQAEQNVKNTMQNISQLTQQKHMLEHDIRKLRSRAEAMRTGDERETTIKGDFIELVDGAGAAGQQGGDEASLKFYRDNNIYPSIVADFQDMRGPEDLKKPDDSDYDNPRLYEVPNNEKAILRKKWAMYEKWKDLYGSEIQRKLKDLKRQLRAIESSIEQTRDWLAPYVRDMVMINEGNEADDLGEEMNFHFSFKGTSTLVRRMEFIAYKPMENDHGTLRIVEDEDEATHYRVIYMNMLHINLAGWEQPQSPAQGLSIAKIEWHPLIVCKHVFNDFFNQKIERNQELFQRVLDEYRGERINGKGDKLREAREEKGMSVRELRQAVNEKVEGGVPIEFSSTIRRVEDGIDPVEELDEEYGNGEDILEVVENVLEIDDLKEEEVEEDKIYTGVEKDLKELMGQVDKFVIPDDVDPLDELRNEFKFNYYYDFKIGLGLYVMK